MSSIEILDKLTGFSKGKTVNKIKITNEMKWNMILLTSKHHFKWNSFWNKMNSHFERFPNRGTSCTWLHTITIEEGTSKIELEHNPHTKRHL